MEKKNHGLSRELIIHPGETLLEIIEDRDMTQRELSVRTGVTEKHVNSIIKGHSQITNSYARKLECALDIPASFWSNLQANYDHELAEYEEENDISPDEISILKPLKDIIAYICSIGLMKQEENEAGQVIVLRKLFRITKLTSITQMNYNAAYRAQTSVAVDQYVLFAWQALCERLTDKIIVNNEFSKVALRDSLPIIRNLMFERATDMQKKLPEIFSKCGIAFSIVRNFKGAPVQGFIKKCDSNGRIILCMTIRGKFLDRFWFTLFHEIGHLLHDDIKQKFIDFEKASSAIERKADEFAKNYLVDEKEYSVFVSEKDFSLPSIQIFARSQHVLQDIIIGRLEADKEVSYGTYTKIKKKYVWKD